MRRTQARSLISRCPGLVWTCPAIKQRNRAVLPDTRRSAALLAGAAETSISRYGLTPRELAVLRQLGSGATNAEIGRRLYMSPKTASVHVSAILRKLGVTGRVQAATVAQRIGLLSPDDDTDQDI